MKKYMKRQVIVDAMQFVAHPQSTSEIIDFLPGEAILIIDGEREVNAEYFSKGPGDNVIEKIIITTIEGNEASVFPGDWIIKGSKGQYYPCSHALFMELYDVVIEEEGTDEANKETGIEKIHQPGIEEKHLLKRIGHIDNLNGFKVTHHYHDGAVYEFRKEFVIVNHESGTVTFQMQYDTIGKVGIVGVQIDEILEFCRLLLIILNDEFPCEENDDAIRDIEYAENNLNRRTLRRMKAGLEGKHEEAEADGEDEKILTPEDTEDAGDQSEDART